MPETKTEKCTFITYVYDEAKYMKLKQIIVQVGAKIDLDSQESNSTWAVTFSLKVDETYTTEENNEETMTVLGLLLDAGLTDINLLIGHKEGK